MALLLRICLLLLGAVAVVDAFHAVPTFQERTARVTTSSFRQRQRRIQQIDGHIFPLFLSAKGFGKSNDDNNKKKKPTGDQVRASTGIRPSLHPIVINAIADALKARAMKELGKQQRQDEDEEELHFRVDPDKNISPLDVAMTAGTFSAKYLAQRQENSSDDDDEILTEKEEQAIAGRIMGVIMRLDDLEEVLQERVLSTTWIADYGEWNTFGVIENESDDNTTIHQSLMDNPLLALNRAECLLGIFLKEVEIPQLGKVSETVPDASKIDFLDSDRIEVLGLE